MVEDTKGLTTTEEIKEFIGQEQPQTPEEIVIAFAYAKVHWNATQKEFSEVAGFSDRLLRQHISKCKNTFNQALDEYEQDAKADRFNPDNLQGRQLSEEDLDKFVAGMIEAGSGRDATARDRELMANFFNIKAEDIVQLSQSKNNSLKWLIRGNLANIKNIIDTKALGISLEESRYIYDGDSNNISNLNNFINADLKDEEFKSELMQFGLIFLSLYNNKAHADMNLLFQAVRLNNVMTGRTLPKQSKSRIKKYVSGKNWRQKVAQPVDVDKLIQGFEETGAFTKKEISTMSKNLNKAENVVKAPAIDQQDIKERTSKHSEELEVLLTIEDEIAKMYKETEQ